ncbi:hypothetical protein [Terriglobus sp.]|uniref:hypothetical protein n=1 Tax=Terriglobus sp. TaxID=1889013 RepID=UPI003B00376A
MRRLLKLFRVPLRLALLAFAVAAVCAIVFVVHCAPEPLALPVTPASHHAPAEAAGVKTYARDEVDTFYTYPEWYIVWSYQAKADYQQGHLPSGFTYGADIAQFWQAYCRMYGFTRHAYPFATGDHVMLAVIGTSFTLEYAIKGAYEKTIGRLSERTAPGEMVEEDRYAANVAEDYAAFVHVRPFYEYSFRKALAGLWGTVPFRSRHFVRSLERRAWLSLDYGVEAIYCEIIELGTHASYGYEDTETAVWISYEPQQRAAIAKVPHLRFVAEPSAGSAIVELPRYAEFTPRLRQLVAAGARIRQISGNELISASFLSPAQWQASLPGTQTLIVQPIASQQATKRTLILMPVSQLPTVFAALPQDVTLEHLYDY